MHDPLGIDAFFIQYILDQIGAAIRSELHDDGNVKPQSRKTDRCIDGSAASMRGDDGCFCFAAFFEQQERAIGIEHAHTLDQIIVDDGDRIDHSAADRQNRFWKGVSFDFESSSK